MDRHDRGGYAPAGPSLSTEGDDDLVLLLQGTIEGAALGDLGSLLEDAIAGPAPRVTIDLSAVTSWSLLAQAMVLNTARKLSSRDRRLVLLRPSAALRRQSRVLGLFERVPTHPRAS